MTASRVFGVLHLILTGGWALLSALALLENLRFALLPWTVMLLASLAALGVGAVSISEPPPPIDGIVGSGVFSVVAWVYGSTPRR